MDSLANGLVVFSLQAAMAIGAASIGAACLRLPAAGRLAYWRLVLAGAIGFGLLAAAPVSLPAPVAAVTVNARSAVSLVFPPAAAGAPALSTYVVAIWIAGAAIGLAWLALGFVALERLRRSAGDEVPCGDEVRRLARDVPVRMHAGVTRPVSFGFIRPVILLPLSVRDLPVAARAAIVDHERLHVARRDWASHVLEELVHAALWFHPGIWLAIDRIRLHREQAIDDIVAQAHDRRVYMDTLVRFAELPAQTVPASAFGGRRHLLARMRALASAPGARSSRLRVATVAGGLLLASLTAACALSAQQRVFTPDDDGVTGPTAIRTVQPSYSQAAMDTGIEGEVLLTGVVETDGSIDEVRVVESLDADLGLDDAAVEAARAWRFEPGTRNGEPVPVEVTLQFRFTLRRSTQR